MVLGDRYVNEDIAVQRITVDRPFGDVLPLGNGRVTVLYRAHDNHLAPGVADGIPDTAFSVSLLRRPAKRLVHDPYPLRPGSETEPGQGPDHFGIGGCRIFIGMVSNADIGLDDDIIAFLNKAFDGADGFKCLFNHQLRAIPMCDR